MCTLHRPEIHLGFTDEQLPAGTHICHLYSENIERDNALLQFLSAGLDNNERVASFSDVINADNIIQYLQQHGHPCSALRTSAQLTVDSAAQPYFDNDEFDPTKMLALLRDFQEASQHDGQTAARVIGDMPSTILNISGGNRLIEYEAKVCQLLETHPVTAVCQYNINDFDGATIMKILKVHPMMVVNGAVIHNPFFVPPSVILQQEQDASA